MASSASTAQGQNHAIQIQQQSSQLSNDTLQQSDDGDQGEDVGLLAQQPSKQQREDEEARKRGQSNTHHKDTTEKENEVAFRCGAAAADAIAHCPSARYISLSLSLCVRSLQNPSQFDSSASI